MFTRRIPLLERALAKVSPCPITGCWWWLGVTNEWGYGTIRAPGKRGATLLAHRALYVELVGPIPDGRYLLHTCHNGTHGCANPWHVRPGTNAENVAERHALRRDFTKYDDSTVAAVRAAVSSGESRSSVSRRTGISLAQVSRIVSGKRRATCSSL